MVRQVQGPPTHLWHSSGPSGPAQAKGQWLGWPHRLHALSLQGCHGHVADDGLRALRCRGRAEKPAEATHRA